MSSIYDFEAGRLLYEEESVMMYREGGFHPTHIGDEFDNGRYKVEMKLGYGGFSTVWLATDRRNKVRVSLKIVVAAPTRTTQEAQNIERISELLSDKPKSWRLSRLETFFHHEGPNGRHLCLVYELLGPNLRTALGFCHFDKDKDKREYLRPETILKISKQLLQAIALLHSVGAAHGDLRLSNVVFADTELRKMTVEELTEELGECDKKPLNLRSRHGLPELSLGPEKPRELTESVYWNGWDGEDEDDICLVDFGESFFEPVESSLLAQPLDLTAPESVFEDHVDYRVDLWRAGAIIYSLVFSLSPFYAWRSKALVIDQMVGFVEKLPPQWHQRWVEERKAAGQEAKGRKIEDPKFDSLLEYNFHTILPDRQLKCLFPVIQGLMKFLPSDRISAVEALSLLDEPSDLGEVQAT